MYEELVEKLVEVDEVEVSERIVEAVATEVSPEKAMMREYEGGSKKLVKSQFSDVEAGRYKFWLLTNGMLIPVKKNDTHNFAAQKADTDIFSLLVVGAIRGYVKTNDEMGIHWESGRPLTSKQRSVLRNLFIEYKINTVHWNPKDDFITAFPKSSEAFDYLITYGKDVDEAVATEVSPEKAMRAHYKKTINGKLKGSTWATETDWYKFWMFKNGDYVPVNHSHAETANGVVLSSMDLEWAGMIQGSVKLDQKALAVRGDKSLTSQQIARLRQFYIEYKVTELYVSFPTRVIGSFGKPIGSAGELEYALEYGLDESIDEAIEVPEYLYHGTFKPLLSKIKSEGLRIEGTVKNYSDSEEGLIYLAKTYEEAEAFAEVSEAVPDEWVDQIVVLRIDTDKLDKSKLDEDSNVRDMEVMTFVYSQDIPSEALEVVSSSSGLDEASGYMGIIEAGWIHSNGKVEELKNYVMGDHIKDTHRKMYPNVKDPDDDLLDKAYMEYMSQGHIRYVQSDRGFNIELMKKPTDSQMRAIRKGIKENKLGEFYFETRLPGTGRYGVEGSSWKEFMRLVQKMP